MRNAAQPTPYWIIALLLLFPLLAFWQVGFMQYTMKWDAMDQFFQHHFFICECISQGQMPLWNPYQHLGAPFYADPQGGFWYPIAWLLGAIMPCDARLINAAFVVHVIIGGFGMYRLLRGLGIGPVAALCFALAYQCNGVFVSNAQHTPYIIAAAWVPFIIDGFLRLLRAPGFKHAILLGGVAAMLVVGGYPSFTIILAYFLALLGLVHVGRKLAAKQFAYCTRVAGFGILSVLVLLLLAGGYIYAFQETYPFITRHSNLTMAQILFGAYTPKSMLSTVLPYVVSADKPSYGSDISMINGYMGLLVVVFGLPGLLYGQLRYKWFFVLMAGVALAAAVGDALPVREWMALWLPGMDKFRFPSSFRLFWMIGAMVISASGLQYFITAARHSGSSPKLPKRILLFLGAGLLVVLVKALSLGGGFSFPPLFNMGTFNEYYGTVKQADLFATQAALALGLLLLLTYLLYQRLTPIAVPLIILVAAELLVATQLNVPATVISDRKMNGYLANQYQLPQGFPLPTNAPLGHGFPTQVDLRPSYFGLNTLHKQVGTAGFNPFQLKSFYAFSETSCVDSVLANPLAYMAHGTVEWQKWAPGKAALKVQSINGGQLVLSQTYYPSWQVWVDGQEAPIEPYCNALLGVNLKPGTHEVAFSFQKATINILLLLSFGGFACWFLFIAALAVRPQTLR